MSNSSDGNHRCGTDNRINDWRDGVASTDDASQRLGFVNAQLKSPRCTDASKSTSTSKIIVTTSHTDLIVVCVQLRKQAETQWTQQNGGLAVIIRTLYRITPLSFSADHAS